MSILMNRILDVVASYAIVVLGLAIAGATVAVELDPEDRIRRCAIGLLGLGATPLRARAAEAALTGTAVREAGDVGQLSMVDIDAARSDLHASASYRRHVGAVVVTRAWDRAVEEARHA